MNLNDALTQIAQELDLSESALISYASEDTVGGYHKDAPLAKWPMGSLWEVEGQVLYAIVRALKPSRVLQIGTYFAASDTHILAALTKNKKGELISLDIEPMQGDGPDPSLRKRWKFIQSEGSTWIRENCPQADIVFEDAFHDRPGTETLLRAIHEIINPRVVLSHDAEHVSVREAVQGAWKAVYGDDFHTALIEPSDCGLAWRVRHD